MRRGFRNKRQRRRDELFVCDGDSKIKMLTQQPAQSPVQNYRKDMQVSGTFGRSVVQKDTHSGATTAGRVLAALHEAQQATSISTLFRLTFVYSERGVGWEIGKRAPVCTHVLARDQFAAFVDGRAPAITGRGSDGGDESREREENRKTHCAKKTFEIYI